MKRYLVETIKYENDANLEDKLNAMTKKYRVKTVLSDEIIRHDLGKEIRVLLELKK